MTTLTLNKLSIAEALNSMLKEPLPLRFTAYDGSATGPEDSPLRHPPGHRARPQLHPHRAR